MGDDGAAMIDNTFGLVSEAIGLGSLFNSGPSVDEQVFEQVVELRQQVEEMRLEMNERFDRIDQRLNIMFDSMMAGFNTLGDQIGDLQTDVDGLVLDMAATRSQLRRLEASLYGVAEDILLTDLTSEANIVLDFRDENGVDLPYNGGSPDFITASENFFTYANVTALSEAFAGSRSNPTLTVSNADETVGAGPVARRINDLVVLPQSFGLPALASTDLVGLEPWSQAAAAYSQLAKESPWYFAYRYGRQLDDYNADPQNESLPELDRTILSGDRLISFIEAIRAVDDDGNSALFDALIEHYRQAATEFQDAVDVEIASTIPDLFTNGSTTLDYWQFSSQNIEPIVPRINALSLTNHGDLSMPSDAPRKGYRTLSLYESYLEPTWTQTWHTLKKQEELEAGRNPDNFKLRGKTYVRQSLDRCVWQIWLGNSGTNVDYTAYREIEFAIQFYFLDSWVDWPAGDTLFRQLVAATWPTFDDYVPIGRDWIPVGSGFYNAAFPHFRLLPIRINSTPIRQPSIQPKLFDRRVDVRNHLLSELLDTNSPLSDAAGKLDDAEALIDAYVSLGMPEELNQSDPLRSALRAVPGTSEYGLRTTDLITLILDIDDADSPESWADQVFNVTHLDDLLIDRIDLVEAEILAGLQRPAKAPGYIGYMLAELNYLRDNAFGLSVDDSYTADTNGFVEVTSAEGMLSNDVMQEFTTILVDTAYELDPAYVAPQNGQVTVNANGSLSYQADPGFVGTDSFTYRAITTINGTNNSVYSAPATVVIKVTDPSCSPADLAMPYGELDFFDVSAFLIAFNSNDPSADLNGDGQFNFFDVSEFLMAFGLGCP